MYASSVMDQKAPRRLLVLLMWLVAGGPDTGTRADEDIHQRSRVPSPSVDAAEWQPVQSRSQRF